MPKFNKREEELDGMFEKWLFVLRNLSRLMERPKALQERVFTRLFEAAEIAKFSVEEYESYEESLKIYRDWKNTIDFALIKGREKGFQKGFQKGSEQGWKKGHEKGRKQGREEGRAEGRAEGRKQGKLQIATQMKADGIPAEVIVKYTGLTFEEIQKLPV